MKTKRVFTPIEKATDEAGGENKEADGGLMPPSAHTVRERSSLMGFTLLEIMITVVIVGVLAALAIPSYWGALERSRQREAVVNLGLLLDSQKRYYLEYDPGSYTTDFADLDMDDPTPNAKYFSYTLGATAAAVATATRLTTENAVNANYGDYNITVNETGVMILSNTASRQPPAP